MTPKGRLELPNVGWPSRKQPNLPPVRLGKRKKNKVRTQKLGASRTSTHKKG